MSGLWLIRNVGFQGLVWSLSFTGFNLMQCCRTAYELAGRVSPFSLPLRTDGQVLKLASTVSRVAWQAAGSFRSARPA
jgi:hypothetical protein